jgi:hypothetical protein
MTWSNCSSTPRTPKTFEWCGSVLRSETWTSREGMLKSTAVFAVETVPDPL